MSVIEYFYSTHSAYAYLGSNRLMAIAREAGRTLVHKPVDLSRVIAGAGSTPTRARTPAHRQYFFGREIQRWSEERDAPVVAGIPTHHHNDTTAANCLVLAGLRRGLDVDALAHTLLEAHWRDDADLADTATLVKLADGAGYPGDALLDDARLAEVRAAYDDNTEEAIARSVFGSPTYFVDDDMFYGQDRLEMVARAVARPYR